VDEVVQDSWANLHHARHRYEPRAAFRTWFFQIARNRLLDLLRQDGRVVLASELGDGAAACFEQPAEQEQPDAAAERKQEEGRLHAAIRALPDAQREVLVLQQFNGMSLEEIAALTGANAETVKSRLRYAMRKLREQLEPSATEGQA
jgi:RNA polymerase sigma-70 factor (ECF subfamily)